MSIQYKTRRGQSTFDVLMQNCGQLDNLFEVLLANPALSLTDDPAPFTVVVIPDGLVTPVGVASFYVANDFTVNNHGEPTQQTPLRNIDEITHLTNINGNDLLNIKPY